MRVRDTPVKVAVEVCPLYFWAIGPNNWLFGPPTVSRLT